MKNSKRILGVVLAIIMIFNVFAVGTFAAYPSDSAVKLSLSTDKAVYAPGDEIVITFSEEAIEELKTVYAGGVYHIAYPGAVLSPIVDGAPDAKDHGMVGISSSVDVDTSYVQYNSGIEGEGGFIADADAAAYAWDEMFGVGVVYTDDTIDISNKTDVFSIKMKIDADAAPGTYTIGFNAPSYSDDLCLAYVLNPDDSLYGNAGENAGVDKTYIYDLGTVTFKVGAAVSVESKGTMAHMNNWEDTEATTYTAGLVGQINGLALTFNETTGECNEIKEIKVTVEGSDKVGYAYKVYKVDDTTYQFRAILLDTPKTGTTALKYTFHVKLADDTVVTCSDETTAKAIFDTAYAKYQAANP